MSDDEESSSSDDGYPQQAAHPSSQGVSLWKDYPERDSRLLQWFREHPEARDVVFSHPMTAAQREAGHLPTKTKCYLDAAKDLFSIDDDPAIRKKASQEPLLYAKKIKSRMLTSWKTKYQKINKEIGSKASNSRYEDLDSKSRQKTQCFHLWRSLHVYWRTNPYFNPYWKKNSSHLNGLTQRPKSSMSCKAAYTVNRCAANYGTIASKKQAKPTGHPSKSGTEVVILDEDTDDEGVNGPGFPQEEVEEKKDFKKWELERSHKRKREEAVASTSVVDGTAALIAQQKHQEYMAELRIKDQQNELLKMILKKMG
ncbi:hypothetical protein GALMADRAFT_425907 [Galerina marginata CBS 339.88]|uniref:Uncharacterized protein n=1 Tax=Galerina marginata (strain CBS 339.88) TaxID=685588 RepID=A0A067TAX4_GALM3|nr:hypothetical protein GALMADRAFT_425907 [Galerina marginata CBS 339.88]